jgi:hypothetical protein
MTASPRPPRESAGYIPWWLLAIVAAFFGIAALALAAFALSTRPAREGVPAASATAIVVTAPPPLAPPAFAPTGAAALTPASTPAPTVTSPPPPPPPGEVKVGSYVQVVGTAPEGFLNLRAEPSLSGRVNYLALEREVLQVQAGPAEADGFVWWYLVDPATNTKFGWGVQNYLQAVQGP